MKTAEATTKVLIADDSAVFRKLVEQTLEEKSYSLLFARNQETAKKQLISFQDTTLTL